MEPVGVGNALGGTDQLAVELGKDKADGLGGTGGVGDDVLGGCAGTTEVALALRAVEDHLVTGEGMDGGHDARDDGGEVVEALGHRGQAVGGAGGRRDDVVIGGQYLVVDVIDDGGQVVARRGRDDDLPERWRKKL